MFNQTTDILLKIPATNHVTQCTGNKISIINDSLYTSCPECNSRMWVYSNSFICENYMCKLKTATPIEYLAAAEFNCSIKNALEKYIKIVDPNGRVIIEKNQTVEDLVIRRRLLQLIIDSSRLEHQSFDDITINGWLRLQGIDINNIQNVAIVWNQATMSKYNDLVQNFDLKKIPKCDYYLVVPYMTSGSSLGGILFTSPSLNKPIMHTFSSKKYMWAGMFQSTHIKKEYLVTSSFSNLLELLGNNKLVITDQIPLLCVHVNKYAFDYDFIPSSIHYLFDPVNDIVGTNMTALNYDCGDLKIGNINTCPTVGVAYTWDKFLEKYVMFMINKFGLTDSIINFLDSCELTSAQEYKVLNSLSVGGLGVEYNKLKQHFSNKIIYIGDNTCVSQMSDGYVVSTGKTTKKVSQISNFTLEVGRNVAFPEQKKVLSETTVHFKDQEFKVWLPVESLETANSVEEAVRNAWITGDTSTSSNDSIPLIISKLDYRKFIAPYTRSMAAKCTYSQGISFLGWDFKKTLFQGPGWVIDAGGLKESHSILYPESDFLNMFKTTTPLGGSAESITSMDKKNIAILLAIIGRGFFSKLTPGIKADKESNKSMTDLLYTLGQSKYYSPDSREIKIENNNGFPVGTINTSEFYRQKTLSPVIDLDRNNNMLVTGEYKGYLFYILTAVVTGILNNLINSPNHFSSSDITNTLVKEGLYYVEQTTGERWEIAIKEDAYDSLFTVFNKEDIQTAFKINPSKGTVKCTKNKDLVNLGIGTTDENFLYLPITEFTSKAYTYYDDYNLDFDFELA